MNLSAILVVAPVSELGAMLGALRALPGVEVHHTDPATGRTVITQAAESVSAEVEGLRRIKALPHVILAEMVCHHFPGDEETIERTPRAHSEEGRVAIPPCLDA